MVTLIFTFMMIAVFGRLLGCAVRLSWGIARVLLSLVFLPVLLIGVFAAGLIRLAFPVLAVVGLVSLIRNRHCLNA